MILNRITGLKLWFRYWRCRLWYRHEIKRLEIWDDAKLMGYNDEFIGCRLCDLWRIV